MENNKTLFYYEKCDQVTMPTYFFFLDKLEKIQSLSKKIIKDDVSVNNSCIKCNTKNFYQLGNIIWSSKIKHKIKTHQSYPSEYFIKIIINTWIINNTIVNPPIEINANQISSFNYIPLHYNKLLIIDALMNQGSSPRYSVPDNGQKDKFLYSEHSGVISVKNKRIDNIIVSAETNRMDTTDNTILLPINTEILGKYQYLFHTHPNNSNYGGRMKDGIIYEFPSTNDLFNFIKYYNEGKPQASLIVSPEGSYLIRPIRYVKKYNIKYDAFHHLKDYILKLEKMAIEKFQPYMSKISNPDFFHTKIGSDLTYINLYNKHINPTNLFIEFYPREKKNGEWCLRQINLPYIERSASQ